MEPWSTHHLYQEAVRQCPPDMAVALRDRAAKLISNGVAVVFTLRHLSRIVGVDYRVLRDSVNRKREAANYRMYAVAKRSGGRRFIHSVSKDLFRVQDFVNREILQKCPPSRCSFAFHPSGGIRNCAAMHCGAKWLFQFDLRDFFYSVNEFHVHSIFLELGYSDLLAFELARLCTTIRLPNFGGRQPHRVRSIGASRRASDPQSGEVLRASEVPYPAHRKGVGVLPQGAPTSPMLSNLASRGLDCSMQEFAVERGFIYTRYADDITVSASNIQSRKCIGSLHAEIVSRIRKCGFRENAKKTRIVGPGSKKRVLGLLVDGTEPRLSRETYQRIDRHLHAAAKYGIEAVANHERFDSAYGFYNHLCGLVAYVKDVDVGRWHEFDYRLKRIQVPW